MEFIRSEHQGRVVVITLSRGKANALHLPMLEELRDVVEDALASDDVGALVIASDRPRFFSAGFDVAEVFRYDRDRMEVFLDTFASLQRRLLHSPKPVVAALSGHTYAGGAILALSCDFRVMADAPYGFALTEINIGVGLPAHIWHLLANAAGVATARRMFLTGEPVMAAQAREIGLVHELAPEADVTAKAVDMATMLAAKPASTYAAIKRVILEATGLGPSVEGGSPSLIDVNAWFTPEAEIMKKKLMEALNK